jgi:hypothetical protein
VPRMMLASLLGVCDLLPDPDLWCVGESIEFLWCVDGSTESMSMFLILKQS